MCNYKRLSNCPFCSGSLSAGICINENCTFYYNNDGDLTTRVFDGEIIIWFNFKPQTNTITIYFDQIFNKVDYLCFSVEDFVSLCRNKEKLKLLKTFL